MIFGSRHFGDIEYEPGGSVSVASAVLNTAGQETPVMLIVRPDERLTEQSVTQTDDALDSFPALEARIRQTIAAATGPDSVLSSLYEQALDVSSNGHVTPEQFAESAIAVSAMIAPVSRHPHEARMSVTYVVRAGYIENRFSVWFSDRGAPGISFPAA